MTYIDDYSDYGNKVLYRMCEESPKHDNIDKIIGKIWIIGTSYSASIECKTGAKIIDGEDFYKEKVAPAIKKSDIDIWIESVSSMSRITENNMWLALDAHKNLTGLFK